jgi:hypothetical protein
VQLRRLLALTAVMAVLSAAMLPCPPAAAAQDASSVAAASASAASGAFCRSIPRPPDLLPACYCGCHERPSAGGTPTAPGLALLTPPVSLAVPTDAFSYLESEVHAPLAPASAPDPVPLVT